MYIDDFISLVTRKCNENKDRTILYSKKAVRIMYDAMEESFSDFVKNAKDGDELRLFGGLKFNIKMVPGHPMRNPKDGSVVNVPDKLAIKAKVGRQVKKMLPEA